MTDTRTTLCLRRSAGFTLTELMISIALVLLILVGVNLIFRTTADTISAGQALNEALRAHRALSGNLQMDLAGNAQQVGLSGAVPHAEAPFILINSTRVAAFLNNRDELSAGTINWGASAAALDDAIRTIDGAIVPRTIYNHRNHRVDQFSLFAKGSFTRQTADNGRYVAPFTATEAMIWYGHLEVYNGTGATNVANSYIPPGVLPNASGGVPNPNNQYAADWRLGRQAILMKEPIDQSTKVEAYNGEIVDDNGYFQTHFIRDWALPPSSPGTDPRLSPLSFPSNVAGLGSPTMPQSRYDLAGVKLEFYRQRMQQVLAADPNYDWWNFAMGGGFGMRFWCNPFVTGDQATSENMARAVPQIGQGCSQFIVEFAGDFMTQNPGTGALTAATPDGTVDFVIENPGTANQLRSTRWYGFPRDADGDGLIAVELNSANPGFHRDFSLNSIDVIPVADVLGSQQSFERAVPARSDTGKGYVYDDGAGNRIDNIVPFTNANPLYGPTYLCAWDTDELDVVTNPPRPYLIRIIATFTDRNGRLTDGLTQEYVFKLD